MVSLIIMFSNRLMKRKTKVNKIGDVAQLQKDYRRINFGGNE